MNDLKLIKKHYGEKMMHLCRELFPTILETEGLLFSLLEKNFAYSKLLAEDIISRSQKENFKNYIYSLIQTKEEKKVEIDKTVRELLDEAGYVFYECKSEEDIQSFKKYYKSGEGLCTFNGGRLKKCHVFFAVKKDVDEIKRGDKPDRDDEYGTSVISIQFSRGGVNTLSIKNRYNHTVENPDATFSNNLENIIPGLTCSFEREYGLNINQNASNYLSLGNYIRANDGKFYKYNYEINNVYYCPGNIIIDNFEVKHYEKEKYLILDYFMIDLVNKKISLYDSKVEDCFVDEFINIEKIEVNNTDDGKIIKINYDGDKEAIIEVDKYNRIIGYKNDNIKEISDNFLGHNNTMKQISLENVEKIGNGFMKYNKNLQEISLGSVRIIGNDFMFNNIYLKKIYLPNVEVIGNNFLLENLHLEEIDFPKVEIIGNNFLRDNEILQKISLENVRIIGDEFLRQNGYCLRAMHVGLQEINLPNVEKIGNNFLLNNIFLREVCFPKVEVIGDYFFASNVKISKINIENARIIGNSFLQSNDILQEINLPKVEIIGESFMEENQKLKKLNISNNVIVGERFLRLNMKFFVLKNLLLFKSQLINNKSNKGKSR